MTLSISENIKKLRDKFDLTQQELADIARVTNKAVSTWETGIKEPRMGAIERIAQHFGIKKSNIIEDGGMDNLHLEDIDDWTEEELESIKQYKQFLKSQRKV